MGNEETKDREKNDNIPQADKTCFIITPIGNSNSEIYRHINGVIRSVIRPCLKEAGFKDIKAAHEISEPGSINTQVITSILDADLVVANLTGTNPNVMYELCLRHAIAKPVIHICEQGTDLPFDIKDSRTIFYRNDMLGAEELKNNLEAMLCKIDYTKDYKDNQIYNARAIDSIMKEDGGENSASVIMSMLNKVMSTVNRIEANDKQKQREYTEIPVTEKMVGLSLGADSRDKLNLFTTGIDLSDPRYKYLVGDLTKNTL